MRRKWSASPSGSAGAQGSIVAMARSMPRHSADRPALWTFEHESGAHGHRQSRLRAGTLDELQANEGGDMKAHETSRWFSGARARRAAAWSSGSTARGLPTPRRLALRRAAVRLGGPRRRGRPRSTASGRPTSPTTPTSPCRRRRDGRLVRRAGRRERGPAAGAPLRPRRARGRARRAGGTRLGRRADDPALDLVQPELQRELLPRSRARAARSRSRPATSRSRSSTPTTSPTSRSRR